MFNFFKKKEQRKTVRLVDLGKIEAIFHLKVPINNIPFFKVDFLGSVRSFDNASDHAYFAEELYEIFLHNQVDCLMFADPNFPDTDLEKYAIVVPKDSIFMTSLKRTQNLVEVVTYE